MARTSKVAENVYLIVNNPWGLSGWGATYLLDEDRKAIVDTGSGASPDKVLEGIREAGVRPEDIDFIILTHIHLDHSGGAGFLVKAMPRAQVLVHQMGVKHMINPERLVRAFLQVRPASDATTRGAVMLPIDVARVRPISGGEVLELGRGQRLEFMLAPGHAPHDICAFETRNGGVFTGDAVGVYVPDLDLAYPSIAPPGFDPEQYARTIETLRAMRPSCLYFAHFGMGTDVARLLDDIMQGLREMDAMVRESGNNIDEAARRFKAARLALLARMRQDMPSYREMAGAGLKIEIDGFVGYYRGRLAS